MRSRPCLSVIVPVYNLEKWLPACLDSILCQSFTLFEVILVDDGSTDDTPRICESYALRDSRVRVFRKENGGASSARNTGLERAEGDYIAFVDGDDRIEPDMFERLMDDLRRSNADIACCQLDRIAEDGKPIKGVNAESACLTAEEVVSQFFEEGYIKECMYGPYNKIFRRKCVDGARFKPYRYGEDVLFIFQALANAGTVYIDDHVGYHYVQRSGSATNSAFAPERLDYVTAARDIEAICEERFREYAPVAHKWAYRHALIAVRQLIGHGRAKSQSGYIAAERRYLKANASRVSELPPADRVNYLLVMYFPFLIRPLISIRELLKG